MSQHAARYNHRTSRLDCACGETFADNNAHQRHIEERTPTAPIKPDGRPCDHQIAYNRARAVFRCSCGQFESESSYVADGHLAALGLPTQAAAAIATSFGIDGPIASAALPETRPIAQGSGPAPAPAKPRQSWINGGYELDAFMNGFAAGCAASKGPGGVNGAADAWQTYVKARIAHYGAANPGDIPPPPKAVAFDANKLADAISGYAERLDLAGSKARDELNSGATFDTLADFARYLATMIRESGGGS